jgi:hypothetical protein
MNIKLRVPARYRISYDPSDRQWSYLVERIIFFIWWPICKVRSENDAIVHIQGRMAKNYVQPKKILREYTEQDYLVDRITHG